MSLSMLTPSRLAAATLLFSSLSSSLLIPEIRAAPNESQDEQTNTAIATAPTHTGHKAPRPTSGGSDTTVTAPTETNLAPSPTSGSATDSSVTAPTMASTSEITDTAPTMVSTSYLNWSPSPTSESQNPETATASMTTGTEAASTSASETASATPSSGAEKIAIEWGMLPAAGLVWLMF